VLLTKVSPIIDKILLFFVSVVFAIAIAGYFSRDTLLISITAITLALSLTALVGFYKERKTGITPKKERDIELALLQFYLEPKVFAFDTVFSALNTRYNCKISNSNNNDFIVLNSTAVYTYLTPKQLDFAEFCTIYNSRPNIESLKKLVIITAKGKHSSLARELSVLELDIAIEILSSEQTYNLLERLNALPPTKHKLKPTRLTAKEFLVGALSPKATRRYLLTSLLLISSSFFMPISIYFMIFGAICLLLAILSKINIFRQ